MRKPDPVPVTIPDEASKLLEAEAEARGVTTDALLNQTLYRYIQDPQLSKRPEFLKLQRAAQKWFQRANLDTRDPDIRKKSKETITTNPVLERQVGEALAAFLECALVESEGAGG